MIECSPRARLMTMNPRFSVALKLLDSFLRTNSGRLVHSPSLFGRLVFLNGISYIISEGELRVCGGSP